MYGATGAVGSSPIASSAIGASGKPVTPTPVVFRRRGAIGSSPVAGLPIATWMLGTIPSAGGDQGKACFHWAGDTVSVAYWTGPSTSVTFAVPTTKYVLSVGPKKFKQVQ